MELLEIPFHMDIKELSLHWHLKCKRIFLKMKKNAMVLI